ncbi:MAG: polyphenol oxidase family protein [Acidimicrobiales bacterium]
MTTSSTSRPSCADAPAVLGATSVRAYWTARGAGDQRDAGARPAPVPPGAVLCSVRQVHGATVLDAGTLKGSPPNVEADALVADDQALCLKVRTADCAAIALGSPEGVFAAVHAGWRGLVAGVVEAAVAQMTAMGARQVVAGLGPTIGPCCYAFSPQDLAPLAQRYGGAVAGATRHGAAALDLPAAVRAALHGAGAKLVSDSFGCTSCTGDWFSHRRDGAPERQALYVWRAN